MPFVKTMPAAEDVGYSTPGFSPTGRVSSGLRLAEDHWIAPSIETRVAPIPNLGSKRAQDLRQEVNC